MEDTCHEGLAGAVELIQVSASEAVTAENRFHLQEIRQLDQIALITADSYTLKDIPKIWKSTLYSIDQIPAAVAAYPVAQIHLSFLTVTLLLDMDDIRHRITIDLDLTAQWLRLTKMKEETFDAKGLQRLLRLEFGDCLDEAGQRLIQWLSKVEFRNGETMRSELKRDRESLGRSVEAEVTSEAGEMPEIITVAPRIYNDRALQARRTIPLMVDFQPLQARFQLVPVPNSIDDAVSEELSDLQHQIANSLPDDTEIPVLFGQV